MNVPIFTSLLAAIVLSGCAGTNTRAVQPRMDLLGMPVLEETASTPGQRTIVIGPATRWINVDSGDIVYFVSGAKHFAWNFQVNPYVATFDLNQVAPPGALTHRVAVYVAPNPLYGTGA